MPRLEGPGGRRSGLRLLRLRAGEGLRDMIHPPAEGGGGVVIVPSREAVRVGDGVVLEVSLGPLVDEVMLRGVVQDIHARPGPRAPLITVEIEPSHRSRTQYLLDVLEGVRTPTARRHRRVPAEIDVRWWWGLRAHTRRAHSLSLGGAFIEAAAAPEPGFRTEIELVDDPRRPPLRIPARVVWRGESTAGPGFGVQFELRNRELAERLRTLIGDIERVAARLPV